MYSKSEKKVNTLEKIGKVAIQQCPWGYRLRFTVEGQRIEKTIDGGVNKDSLAKARAVASEINSDLIWKRFDPTLVKYGLGKSQPQRSKEQQTTITEITPNLPTLRDVWENYKAIKGQPPSSQERQWALIDKMLSSLPNELLSLSSASKVIPYLKGKYSEGTLISSFALVRASLNLAKKQGMISEAPYLGIDNLKPNKRDTSCKAFSEDDLREILEAFKLNTLSPKKSGFTHSHYYYFVLFRLMTGCRPEDAIALNWGDIKSQNGRDVIVFSKGYSYGELKGTKNGLTRIFPINDQLRDCLEKQKAYLTDKPNPNNLIFPSQTGNYLDLHNFTNRIWRPVVKKLVEQGKVSEYLPFYNLRHNCATFLIRQGIDLQTIATLLETSIEMLQRHYLASDKGINLPNLPFLS